LAHRPAVRRRRARVVERRRRRATRYARSVARRQRDTAHGTERGGQTLEARPAPRADGIAASRAEARGAQRTHGGEKQIEHGRGEGPGPHGYDRRSAADRVDGVEAAAAVAALAPARRDGIT